MKRIIIFLVLIRLAAAPAAASEQPPAPAEPAAAPLRLSVAEAVARARASSPMLDSLRAREAAGQADVERARAERKPVAEATALYTRYSDVPELTITAPGQPPQTIFPNIPDSFISRVGVTVPIFTGGRIPSLIEAAEQARSAVSDEVSTGDADLVLETTSAYWDLATARANVKVLEEALRSYDAHVTDARNRESHGLAARNEVLAVMVERDRAELARLLAENRSSVMEANLVRLIGAPPGTAIETEDTLEAEPAPGAGPATAGTEELVEAAFRNRPERRALAARAEAAEARSRAADAGRFPQVHFNAGYDYSRPNRRILPLTDTWENTWDASVILSYRFFDGGRRRSESARDRADALAAREELSDLDGKIRLDVTRRLLDLDTARAGVEVAERSLESARESRRVASDRYRAGVIPSSELLDAETALLKAGLDRTLALAGVRVAAARLDRAVGR